MITRLSAGSIAPTAEASRHRILSNRFDRVEKKLKEVVDAVAAVDGSAPVEPCILLERESQLSTIQSELESLSRDMLIEDEDETLADKELKLNRDIFDVSVKIKRLLQSQPTSVPVKSGMKLPKLDVPKFDGNIIHWRTFWEQFSVSVHGRDALSNAEKLTYLRHALNDGKAKAVVEGLSSSGDQKHPVYACQKFKGMTQEQMMISLKSNGLCMNCLRPGHFVRQCTSTQKCRKCQKPHHTLLHREEKKEQDQSTDKNPTVPSHPITSCVSQAKVNAQILLMTCRVKVVAPDGSSTQARALLDSASSTCFVSERLAQLLRLPRSRCHAHIFGIGNLHCKPSSQSMAKLSITSMWSPEESFEVEAVVLPKITCDLPVSPVSLDRRWDYIRDLHLADPDFATPGKIDLLLGIEVFTRVMRHGRRFRDERSPVALETSFGWVIILWMGDCWCCSKWSATKCRFSSCLYFSQRRPY